ncbi:MAG: hypothetical protein DRP71_03065 [Verrucomicrobia bacterium]|nr:MAG: hypothetical protein DRP71_03065 [Verrucomicrobiota bacterium]
MNARTRLFFLLTIPAFLQAETLENTAEMQLNPSADAPVILTLDAGSELTPLTDETLPPEMDPAPEGWWAIRLLGSYQGYVSNDDILKDFTVGTGATVYLEPSHDAEMLVFMGAGDEAEVISVTGEWARIVIRKTIGGYVAIPMPGEVPEPDESAPAPTEIETEVESSTIDPGPAPLPPVLTPTPSRAMPPRLFSGRLERTRRIFGRGPKQNFQLIDGQGRVLAYLEIQNLLTTEPVERFLGQKVNVFGVPRKPEGSKIIIVQVESLRFAPQP